MLPVVMGDDERLERTHPLAELRELLSHRPRTSSDHDVLEAIVNRDLTVGHFGIMLQHADKTAVAREADDILEIEPERTVGMPQVVPGFLIGVGDDQGAARAVFVRLERQAQPLPFPLPVAPVADRNVFGTKLAEIMCQPRRAVTLALDEPRLIDGSMIGGCGCW